MTYEYLLNKIQHYEKLVLLYKTSLKENAEHYYKYRENAFTTSIINKMIRRLYNAQINLNRYKMFAKFSRDIYNKYNE